MIPRWTVYPAVAVLFGVGLSAIPDRDEPSFEGAAARMREGVDRVEARSFQNAPVVVLGIDGLDPDLLAEAVERWPGEETENWRWLIESADGIQSLGTSIPPQSPVAWSNFITGLDPGGHGIFDFVHREPDTRGQLPPTTVSEEGRTLPLWGDWQLPIGGDSRSNRTGRSFWEILSANGIPADIWRIPANFPVEPADGLSFPGMMTPVLDGSYGGATLLSEKALSYGDNAHVQAVRVFNDKIDTSLKGPANPLKDPLATGIEATLPLQIYIDRLSEAAAIDTGTDVIVLQPGQWSDFVQVTYSMLPASMMDMTGITRFYLRSIEPGEFELYIAPVNIDPSAPATPVSEPEEASAEVADAIGLYYTQGMAEDVGALKDGLLDDGEFLQQVDLVYDERMRMLDYAMDRFLEDDEGGLLFFYFSTVDLTSHMMWRHADEDHPAHDAELANTPTADFTGRDDSSWKTSIFDVILKMDPALGRVRARLGDEAALIVMSDHGFAPYRRKVNLNAWLLEKGYLVLRDGQEERINNGETLHIFDTFRDGEGDDAPRRTVVDWEQTVAYGLGFNGLYINVQGREGDHPMTEQVEDGKVPASDHDRVLAEVCAALEAELDPKDGARIVLRCDLSKDVYSESRRAEGPDAVVGFAANYGNSDESTLGEIQARDNWIEDNLGGTFNGSHLMAPEEVPGILLSNRPVREGEFDLRDLTVELLGRYGVEPEEGMKSSRVLED